MKHLIILIISSIFFMSPHLAYALRRTGECPNIVKEAERGNIKEVKDLIDNECDINIATKGNMTALMGAAYNGHYEIVKLLLEAGANVNVMDSDDDGGFTALMLATVQGKFAVVKTLLQNGANPNIQRKNGMTALMGAVEEGYVAIAQILLDNGADPTAKDNDGTTALELATSTNQKIMIKLLTKYGAKK